MINTYICKKEIKVYSNFTMNKIGKKYRIKQDNNSGWAYVYDNHTNQYMHSLPIHEIGAFYISINDVRKSKLSSILDK